MARIILVPTPIGNLEDITLRAVRALKEANLIAAEDTRHTAKLLQHLSISAPMVSLHAHNEHHKAQTIVKQVQDENLLLAVVTDAGTPGISDPGFLIVREALAAGVPVETLPGPTAFVPALVSSGLPADRFYFEGFLPVKKGRRTCLLALAEHDCTTILYESPHRLEKTLAELKEVAGGERRVSVARELSKVHEEHVRGTLDEVIAFFNGKNIKGEIVIVLAGKN